MTKKVSESSGNIFLDLGFPPHEAEVMLLRAKLAEALRAWMERESLTQAMAAKRLGITQPRVSEITRGKVLLSLDYLVGLCARSGIPVGLRVASSQTNAAMVEARQTRAGYKTAEDLVDGLKGKRSKKKRTHKPSLRISTGARANTR